MAWLGVNLNESLSSIKGQISSFTREVLAEDGVEEHAGDVVIPRNRVKELESAVYLHQQENKELRISYREVEDRLRAAESSASKRVAGLNQQLLETQKELQHLKEKSSDWDWENGSRNHVETIANETSGDNSDHDYQIASLENRLEQQRRKYEDEIIAIQDAHQSELQRIEKEGADKQSGKSDKDESTLHSQKEQQLKLNQYEEKVSELQRQLASLKSRYDEVCDEKAQLSTSLVELDNEHQQVIDQVLKSKVKVTEELTSTKRALISSQTDLTRNNELLSISQAKINDLLRLKNEMASQLTYIQQKYEETKEEKNILLNEINQIKEGSQSDNSDSNRLYSKIRELEEAVQIRDHSILQVQSELTNDKSLVNKLSNEIQSLSQKLNISQSSMLESEVTKLQNELKDLKKENESIVNKLAANEEKNKKEIEDLKDKISFYQVEVLKYEAVLEEKNNEYVNAYDRLLYQEKFNQNMMHEFDKERREISLKLRDAEDKRKHLEEQKKIIAKTSDCNSTNESVLQQLVKICNVQGGDELPSTVSELTSEVASLRCERDKLVEDLATMTQELRDNQELLETQDLEKGEIERECEDLRDQIEELQCGERQNPEGSVTPRSLPTIEEEEDAPANASESADNKKVTERKSIIGNDACENSKFELMEKVEQLNSQVLALTEARQNLELELSSLKVDKSTLEQSLIHANGQLGNLANLEVEAVSLRTENENLIGQLNGANIQLQSCSSMEKEKRNLALQVEQMTAEMDKMNVNSYKNVNDYPNSQVFFEPGSDLETLQKELDKIRGLLVYKDDQIDQWKQGIEQIGAIFGLENMDLRETFVKIRQEYEAIKSKVKTLTTELEGLRNAEESSEEAETDSEEALTKKIQDLEVSQGLSENQIKVHDEKIKDLQDQLSDKIVENAVIVEKSNVTERKYLQLQEELDTFKQTSMEEILNERKKNEDLQRIITELQIQLKHIMTEKAAAESRFNKLQDDFEQMVQENKRVNNALQNMTEQNLDLNTECEQIKQENQEMNNKLQLITEGNIKLINECQQTHQVDQVISNNLQKLTEENMKLLSESKQMQLENQEISNNLQKITEENLKLVLECKQLQQDNAEKKLEFDYYKEASREIEICRDTSLKDVQLIKERESLLKAEYESVCQQLSVLQQERQQMIDTSTQKHQEAVSYYKEIQRLSNVIQMEKQRFTSQEESMKSQLSVKNQEVVHLQEEIRLLNSKIGELNGQLGRSKEFEHLQLSSKNDVKLLQEELRNVNDELSKQQELFKNIANERDQLRKANATFNSQYEKKTKELNEVLEKERYVSQECIRLKQHLMEIEETYTNEAVQSELRENSLRQSIAKLHEKISSHSNLYSTTKEKSTAQLEALQEKLRDAIFQRDEAVQKLHVSEEASLQHQEGLSRLQQVLQDFQKAQGRDIAQATEREKRKYEEERKKNMELELEMRKLQGKLTEVESTLRATKSMREELQAKEDTVIALKSQVQAVQLAAKKSQEQISILQSSSEAKVDKHLLRNLIVGYFATNGDKRPEVLHVVAQVLDFSAEERARTGIDAQSGSWLSSIANFLAPPPSNMRVSSKVDVLDHTSLSQAFIRFLEEESAPRQFPQLPAVEMAEEATQKVQKKIQAKAAYNTNLLFKNTEIPVPINSASPFHSASMPPSLSTLQPVTASTSAGEKLTDKESSEKVLPVSVAAAAISPSLPTNSLFLTPNSNSLLSPISPISHDTYSTVDEVSEPKFLNNLLNPNETVDGHPKS